MTPGPRGTRVLIVEPSLRDNGAVRSNVRLAQRWTAAGCPTLLLAFDGSPVLPEGHVEIPDDVAWTVATTGEAPLRRSLLPVLRRLLPAARSADVVVAGREMGLGLVLAWGLARLARVPLVVMVRSSPTRSLGSHGPTWMGAVGRRALRGADALVCISGGLVPDVLATGARARGVAVVLGGVEVDAVRAAAREEADPSLLPAGEGPLVVALGRLSRQKGFDVLLRAHRAVLDRGLPHRLLVLGEGEQREELEALVDELGVRSTASLPGFAASPLPVLAAADLYVLSSRWEGFSQTVAESLLVGTPVVSTDCVSGPRELLRDGAHGRLVPVEDVDALADAVADHLRDPEPLRRAAAAGAAWARRELDVDRAAEQTLDVVRRAARGEPLASELVETAAEEAAQESAVSSALSLRELVAEDLRTNHGHRFAPGFHALAVHRFGRWARSAPRPARGVLSVVHKSLQLVVRNVYGIELPVTVEVGRRVVIAHQNGLVLHPEVVLGDDVVLRHNVTLGARDGYAHPGSRVAPVLERGVELAVGAIVVGPVTIGAWAKIGPNAVVTRDVPAGAVVTAGEPTVRERAPRARPRTGRP
ncbi:glycosyltransferase [uncultured Pseudokineococcus sp.]|uniref:glycosyltransferase n=1 Tax=uncultured Pseudokineococcus sp. TaxID=1642928 RepID=UPI002619EB34|nr:glycosyltransferase [uncultured Pseudokineococcus sp.]